MSKYTEIQALISLLDDENNEIVSNVSKKLLSYGEEVIYNLEAAYEQTIDSNLHSIIENLIEEIQFNIVYKELEDWSKESFPDLFHGAEIIAKLQYPELDSQSLKNTIEGFKQKIWLELNNDLTPLETINAFNHVFYGLLRFKGDYKSKPDIADYCINNVLETKKGASILLGIIYITIAQELNLPVYGVNLYKHFVLSFQKNFIEKFSDQDENDSLFYINAMNKGIVFERKEIKTYLKKMKKDLDSKYFSPVDSRAVIKELLFYIYNYYFDSNKTNKIQGIMKLRSLFE